MLFPFNKVQILPGTKRRGTQISSSETAQPNCTTQSFLQQCFLHICFFFSLSQLWRWFPIWAAAERALEELSAGFSLTLLRNAALESLHEYQCICSRQMRFGISVLPHWKHLGNFCHWLSQKPELNGIKQRKLWGFFNWAINSLILLLTSA